MSAASHDDDTTIVRQEAVLGRVRRLGPYELRSELGRGGMGIVYRAYHESLRRDCAVKLLLGERSQTVRERFVMEGQAVARLGKHPHIVQVFDAGVIDDTAYIAMELIDGEPLDEVVKRGPIPQRDVVEIGRKVAMALAHAHQQGIVHRDMKPGNVIVDQAGEPYILDFGLAKDLGVTESTISVAGNIVGTPNYMPPEQADSRFGRVDPRSDVYALGATLFHLVSGRMPFVAERVVDVVVQVLTREPPRLKGSASPDVEAVIFRAMEKQKRHRYQTALELADDLARIKAGDAPRARPVGLFGTLWRKLRRRPGLTLLVGLLLFFAAGSAAYVSWQRGEANQLWAANYAQIARGTADATRDLLEPAIPLLKECQMLARFGLLPVDDPNELARHFAVRVLHQERLSWLSYGDTQGRFTGATRRAEDGAVLINRSWVEGAGGRLHEERFYSHGERETLRQESEWTFDPRKRPWYRTAMTTSQATWLDPYPWFDDGGYGITLTLRYRAEGEVRGAFTADFGLLAISRFLADLDLGTGAGAFLLADDAKVIASSDEGRGGPPGAATAVLQAALKEVDLAALTEDGPMSVELDHAGHAWVASLQRFEVRGGLSWASVVVVPTAVIRGSVDAVANTLLIIGAALVSLLVVGGLGVAVARRRRARRRARQTKKKLAP